MSNPGPTGQHRRSCNFCRARKMKCSGDKPKCNGCKSRELECIYEGGQRIDAAPNIEIEPTRSSNGTLLFPALHANALVYNELSEFYERAWHQSRGWWSTVNVHAAKQSLSINYQTDLSHLLSMAVDALVNKCLPFTLQLPTSASMFSDKRGNRSTHASDSFGRSLGHSSPVETRGVPNSLPKGRKMVQLLEHAFAQHPFLCLIVSRTSFLDDFEHQRNDKNLLNSVLVSALALGPQLTEAQLRSSAQHEALPDVDVLAAQTSHALWELQTCSLTSSKLQLLTQSIVLMAWHDLNLGLLRRSACWWAFACDMTFRIRSLRQLETHNEVRINDVDVAALREEELNNMRAICQIMMLWFEFTFGIIPVAHNLYQSGRAQLDAPIESSPIWQLDMESCNFIVASHFQTVYPGLVCIQRILRHLEILHTGQRKLLVQFRGPTSPEALDASADAEVRSALYTTANRNGTPQATATLDTVASDSVVILSALLRCFQVSRSMSSMSQVTATSIKQACAGVALRLSTFFGSQTQDDHNTIARSRQTPSKGHHNHAFWYSSIILTVIETVAQALGFLLDNAVFAGVSHGARRLGREQLQLTRSARQVVRSNQGCILGILTTILGCLEDLSAGGRRIARARKLLQSLEAQLRSLGVLEDMSFVEGVARRSADAPPHIGLNAWVKEEAPASFEKSLLAPSASSANKGYVTEAYALAGTDSALCSGFVPSQTHPAYATQHEAAHTTGHVVFGEGPLASFSQVQPPMPYYTSMHAYATYLDRAEAPATLAEEWASAQSSAAQADTYASHTDAAMALASIKKVKPLADLVENGREVQSWPRVGREQRTETEYGDGDDDDDDEEEEEEEEDHDDDGDEDYEDEI